VDQLLTVSNLLRISKELKFTVVRAQVVEEEGMLEIRSPSFRLEQSYT
jgi:hypothetical protein